MSNGNTRLSSHPNGDHEKEYSPAAQASRYDRKRMRKAMHVLEDALSSGSPTRHSRWMQRVGLASAELAKRMHAQRDEFYSDEGLLAEIVRDCPRLEPRVVRLQQLHSAALRTLSDLSEIAQVDKISDDIDVAEIREKLGDALSTIRNLHATESDLIYEAYNVDIGIGD